MDQASQLPAPQGGNYRTASVRAQPDWGAVAPPQGTIRMAGLPPQEAPQQQRPVPPPPPPPSVMEVRSSELIHPMSPNTYQNALTAAQLAPAQRGYIESHFTGSRAPFEVAVGNAVEIVRGMGDARPAGDQPVQIRGMYDRRDGRLIGTGEVTDAQVANAVEFTATVDRQSGRIVSMNEAGMRNAYLSELVGLQVMPGRGGGGTPGGNQPPGGGGTRPSAPREQPTPQAQASISQLPTPNLNMGVPEQRAELARRMVSGDQQAAARSRFNSLSESERNQVGYEVAYELHLDTKAGIEDMGRRLMERRAGAEDQLALLPQNVRDQIARLYGDGGMAGQFRVPRTRRTAVNDVWNQVQQMLHENAPHAQPQEQSARAVVGAEVPVLVVRPAENQQIARDQTGNRPVAMANEFWGPHGPFRRDLGNIVRGAEIVRDEPALNPPGGRSTARRETGVFHVQGLERRAVNDITLDTTGQVELGRRIVAGDQLALERYRRLPEDQQRLVATAIMNDGIPMGGRTLVLNNETDAAAFARALVREEPVARTVRDILPEEARAQVDAMTRDPALRMQAVIEPHLNVLLPMLQEPNAEANVRNALSGIVPAADLDRATTMILGEARNSITNMADLQAGLGRMQPLIDLGDAIAPFMGKLRGRMPTTIKQRRGPGITVERLMDPADPNFVGAELERPIPLFTGAKGQKEANAVTVGDIDRMTGGFRTQLGVVYGDRFIGMADRLGAQTELMRRVNGIEDRTDRANFLRNLANDPAQLQQLVPDAELRAYISGNPDMAVTLFAARDVLDQAAAFRGQFTARARLTYRDGLSLVENMQRVVEQGFQPVTFRVASNDGSTVYNITINPATISHMTEGHAETHGTAQITGLINDAIGAQPYGRISVNELRRQVQSSEGQAAPNEQVERVRRLMRDSNLTMDQAIRQIANDEGFTANMTFEQFRQFAATRNDAGFAFSRLVQGAEGQDYRIMAVTFNDANGPAVRRLDNGQVEVNLSLMTLYGTGRNGPDFARSTLVPGF